MLEKDSAKCSAVSFADHVAVLILTYNEAPNIARTLDALRRFPEVVVLDSGSLDETIELAHRYPNTRVIHRDLDQHATQWNYGLTSCGIERPWILALDADYMLTDTLVTEISSLPFPTPVAGYRARFRYCVYGQRLSADLYPPHVILFRRSKVHYIQEGHTQRAVIDGPVGELVGYVEHDDRKPLSRWFKSQRKYAKLEAEYLLSKPRHALRRVDRLRLSGWAAPLLVPIYTLFWKGCLFDGRAGWAYVLQRTVAEAMIALEVLDRTLRDSEDPGADE